MEHPTGAVPQKIAIVGCGPSMQDYVNIMASHQSVGFNVDEVWSLNGAGAVIKSDVCFIMDDAAIMNATGSDLFQKVKMPVITSAPRRDGDIAFPLAEILNIPGARDYLNHSAAYLIAYAIMIGVKEVCIFGCDYIANDYRHAPNQNTNASRYMACLAYWCGIAAARGISITPTPNSPFLDADAGPREKFYGYAIPPIVKREGE